MSHDFEWKDLDFWNSGEWQVVEEHLDELKRSKTTYNPERKALFASLDATPFAKCKAAIIGQDPYPDHSLCTGIAFSIPKDVQRYPPTLEMIFDEYETDLHYPRPKSGDLHKWCDEGVLLWNTIPTCLEGKSLSHQSLFEWGFLTKEIIERLSNKGVVFCFLGGIAGTGSTYVSPTSKSSIIKASHPSPRGNKFSRVPFIGSRIFTTINDKLCDLGHSPVNWRLD